MTSRWRGKDKRNGLDKCKGRGKWGELGMKDNLKVVGYDEQKGKGVGENKVKGKGGRAQD